MTDSSKQSYKQSLEDGTIPAKDKDIYNKFMESGPCTWQTIAEKYKINDKDVTSPLNRLVQSGWVQEIGSIRNKGTNRDRTVYKALTIKGPGKIVGHKKDGLFINKNDVQAILDRKEIHTKDYDIWFGKDVLVVFHKIFLEMRDVKAIGINDSNMMYFANEGATLKVPII